MARSSWKVFYLDKTFVFQNKAVTEKKSKDIVMLNRSTLITPHMVGLTVNIYNGLHFFEILIQSNMVGHRFGEFAPTRKTSSLKNKNKK